MITVVATKVSFGAVGLGMAAERVPVDQTTVATQAGAIPVGTRIDVLWTHPTRWETGTIARLDTRFEGRGEKIVIYYDVAYDDGHRTVEDLRYVQARLHSTLPPSDGSASVLQLHGRKRRSSRSNLLTGSAKPQKDTPLPATEVEVQVMLGDGSTIQDS